MPPPSDTALHDVGHEYFSSSRHNYHTDSDKTPSERLFTSFLTRSPSQPSPPTLAPRIMDSNISDLHTLFNDPPTKDDIRPSSSPSSSAFSARWMSNLLKTSTSTGLQQHGQAVASTLQSILGVGADTPPSSSHFTLFLSSGTPPPTAASTVSAIHRRSSSTLPLRHHQQIAHQHPHTSQTLPRPIVIKHTASPFSSQILICRQAVPPDLEESHTIGIEDFQMSWRGRLYEGNRMLLKEMGTKRIQALKTKGEYGKQRCNHEQVLVV